MKRGWRILLVLAACMMLFSGTGVHASALKSRKAVQTTGWIRKSGNIYYLKKGRKLTGWQKISKYDYYFNSKGVLQSNRIVGSKSKGYYYVDADGVRITDPQIMQAVAFVTKNSDLKATKMQRLRSCYKALCSFTFTAVANDKPCAKNIPSYANYMFTRHTGNCYRYSAAMAYIARVIGYDAGFSVGGVSSRATGALTSHGPCRVRVNGVWYFVDCSMGRKHTTQNLFMVSRGEYPFRLRIDRTYKLNIRKHKVKWNYIGQVAS